MTAAKRVNTLRWALTARRRVLGVTQLQLGRRLGVSQGTISDMEAGRTNLTVEALINWAWALSAQAEITLLDRRGLELPAPPRAKSRRVRASPESDPWHPEGGQTT